MPRNPEDQQAYEIVRKLFKNDYGEPFEMTDGQIELFRAIYEKQHPRLQFDCYTQYGKSDVVSMAVLLRATTFPEKWIILGATKDKAAIIMSKVIKHIFENDYTLGKFQVDEGESLDFIRRNRAKDNISFKVDEKNIGQIITLSADARRKSADAGDILIGHGGQNLIEDDAALIPDPIHGKALRMLGGHTGKREDFLLKITNSFGHNHAYDSACNSDNIEGTQAKEVPAKPLFHRIVINYERGLKEGRLSNEFIEEMRRTLDPVMFGILYECKYPPANMVEDGGWMPFLTDEQVQIAQARNLQSKGFKKMGVDIAEGTNANAYVIRTDNVARVKEKSYEADLMKTADKVVTIGTEEHIDPSRVWMDAVAIGAGPLARVKQLGFPINAFKGGEKPTELSESQKRSDPVEYYNLRAEVYWKMRQWILEVGYLEPHSDWRQLTLIRYRVTSEKKIQIMSKEEMRARALLQSSESTDVPDALSMTFAPPKVKVFNQPQMGSGVLPYYPELGI